MLGVKPVATRVTDLGSSGAHDTYTHNFAKDATAGRCTPLGDSFVDFPIESGNLVVHG